MPEFIKVWSVANIALIKLKAKLALSVLFKKEIYYTFLIRLALNQII